MIGTPTPDFVARMKAALPARWFADDTPVLDSLLTGLGAIWSQTYALMTYVAAQRRISTATDVNLDLISLDFLANRLPRLDGESDASYRGRLKAAIFSPAGTRAAVIAAVTALTGQAPQVFEPANARDTGGYGSLGMTLGTGLGYGVAGGWGSIELPFQAFITAIEPKAAVPPGVQGYYTLGDAQPAFGGYGLGALEYLPASEFVAAATSDDVLAAVDRVKPIGSVMWVNVSGTAISQGGGGSPGSTTPLLDVNFILDVSQLS
jgi:hypothetical protein